jgi:hypothetical protein
VTYAKDTSVSTSQSEGDIKKAVIRAGATTFMSGQTSTEAMIAFELRGRRITFRMPLPDRASDAFRLTPSKKWLRSEKDAETAWEQACRSRWRALYLCIKAKLESVESGIETFEDAFLAHIQMPDGQTVSEHVKPRIAAAYESGSMQPLLPGPK